MIGINCDDYTNEDDLHQIQSRTGSNIICTLLQGEFITQNDISSNGVLEKQNLIIKD